MKPVKISFSDRFSSTLQPIFLLCLDYVSIIAAEAFAVLFRECVLVLLDREYDAFDIEDLDF